MIEQLIKFNNLYIKAQLNINKKLYYTLYNLINFYKGPKATNALVEKT